MKTQEKLNFQSEKIYVDWISFKFQSLEIASQRKLVNYLFELSFNCFVQSGKLSTLENKELKVSRLNPNSVLFVKDGPLLHFSGKNAKQFYQYAKTNSINWNLFSNAVLSRLDLCYISDVPIDSESVEDFFIIVTLN